VLKDCLVSRPEDPFCEKAQKEQDSEAEEECENQDSDNGNGESTGLELMEDDVQRITEPIQPLYRVGVRHNIVFSLSCLRCIRTLSRKNAFYSCTMGKWLTPRGGR
jgi:hypothetical protein